MRVEQKIGVNLFLARRYAPEEYPAILAKLKDLGVTYVREEISLKDVFFQRGVGGFSQYDRAFQTLHQQGFRILLLISDFPPSMEEWVMAENAPLAGFIAEIIHRYQHFIPHFQIGNEVNTERFWGGPPNAQLYANLLSQIRKKLKTEGRITLLSAGFAGTDLRYLEEFVARGGAEAVDVFAFHPYTFPAPLKGTDLELAEEFIRRVLPKQVWVTELGWPTSTNRYGISETLQAKYLQESLGNLNSLGVSKIFWYDFRDDGYEAEITENRMGLISRDNREKPAYITLKNWLSLSPEERKLKSAWMAARPLKEIPTAQSKIVLAPGSLEEEHSLFLPMQDEQGATFPEEFQCIQVDLSVDLTNWYLGYQFELEGGETFEGVMTRIVWKGKRTVTAFLPEQERIVGKRLRWKGLVFSRARGFGEIASEGKIEIFSARLCSDR